MKKERKINAKKGSTKTTAYEGISTPCSRMGYSVIIQQKNI
jgi:hypothetical protein